MRTIGRSDAADDCPDCRAYWSADRCAEGGTRNSSAGCSHTTAHGMRTRFTRHRVGIFPRFFLHSFGCGIALNWFANRRASGREEGSSFTREVRQSD
jgi:hypothetical protein